MYKDQSTPERELLKIIEKGDNASSVSKESFRRGLSFLSLGALKGRFSFLRRNFRGHFSGLVWDLKSINRLLMLILGFSVIFISFNTWDSYRRIDREVSAIFEVKPPQGFQFPEVSVLKKISFYLENARKRDIFKMVEETKKEVEKKEELLSMKKEDSLINERVKNLRLVGIAWSDDPDVMIEDTNTKKTYFLKRGDYINGLEVKAVFRDKVILGYNTEEVELK